MSLLGKKKVINPTLFNDRLASIKAVFKHLESGKTANLSNEYVYNMLNTSDQYEKEVKKRWQIQVYGYGH